MKFFFTHHLHKSKTFATFGPYNNQNTQTMSTSPLLQADGAWADFCQRLVAQRIPTVKAEVFGIHYDTMEVHLFHHRTLDVYDIAFLHEICPAYHETHVHTRYGEVFTVRHFDQLDEEEQVRIVEEYVKAWAHGKVNISGHIKHNTEL